MSAVYKRLPQNFSIHQSLLDQIFTGFGISKQRIRLGDFILLLCQLPEYADGKDQSITIDIESIDQYNP